MSVYFPTHNAHMSGRKDPLGDVVLVPRAIVVSAADLSYLTYLYWKSPQHKSISSTPGDAISGFLIRIFFDLE